MNIDKSNESDNQVLLNKNQKIAVALHVFHMDVLPDIFRRLKNIAVPYDLIVTVSQKLKSDLESALELEGQHAKIIVVDNIGYDVLPFIKVIPLLLEKEYDLVCKIHTKKGLANLESTYPDAGNIWLDLLLDPIMGSQSAVNKIVERFAQDDRIGVIGSADIWRSAKALMYGNNVDVFNLSQLLMPGRDPAKDWGFFAGSIFWAKVALLKPLLDLEAHLEQASDSSHVTGEFCSVWHATERVFGMLSETAGKEVALAYSVNSDVSNVEILLAKESRIPKGSPYSIGASISGCLKLESDRNLLVKTPGFDREFYLTHYSFLESWGVDSLYHYLRYGVYERCNPNDRFSSAWYWEENRDVCRVNINPLVHYTTHGFSEGRSSFPAEENMGLIRSIIDKPGIFSRSEYLERYPDVAKAKIDPLVHYSKFGWAEKRQPAASNNIFDHFWYNDEYLRHWRYPIDPLLHYIICERRRVVYPVPSGLTMELMNEGHRFPDNATPRRICLFAGYDPQGVVDESVVDFIAELNKHADVYYLCDASLFPQELSKLEGITKGAWGIRHGEYDFGSYSRLVRDLVGWEKIREYDELLLVNDSSYLINSLDYVFSKMDGKSCDWWALQATKGISATKDDVSNQFSEKVPFDYVIDFMLPLFEEDEVYDFFLGPDFLGFRVPLLQEGGELQKMLDNVAKEKNIIIRYEIGLTRRLMQKGSRSATFIDSLYFSSNFY